MRGATIALTAVSRFVNDGTMGTTTVGDVQTVTLGGQIPLEALDFVVDPVGKRLTGNPEHGGQHMIDLF